MTPAATVERAALQKLIRVLWAGYHLELSEQAFYAYLAALRGIETVHIRRACERAVQTLHRAPSPAQLRRLALEAQDEAAWTHRRANAAEAPPLVEANIEASLLTYRQRLATLWATRRSERAMDYPEVLGAVREALHAHSRGVEQVTSSGLTRAGDILGRIADRAARGLVSQWLREASR